MTAALRAVHPLLWTPPERLADVEAGAAEELPVRRLTLSARDVGLMRHADHQAAIAERDMLHESQLRGAIEDALLTLHRGLV